MVVWGKETAGTTVTVSMVGNSAAAVAAADGKWIATLAALKANSGPHEITIKGSSTIKISDVLVGEVWVCSGQSNMQWPVRSANDGQLEALAAKFPRIRLITVTNEVGTQEAQDNFEGKWEAVSPETVLQFSAVGYFFGRQLHQTLNVPIGLIECAGGGSACEAWIPRDVLQKHGHAELLTHLDQLAEDYSQVWSLKELMDKADKAEEAEQSKWGWQAHKTHMELEKQYKTKEITQTNTT